MVCHAQSATTDRPHRAIPTRPPTADLTVDHAIGLYLDGLVPLGAHDSMLIRQGHMLRRFFRPALGEPLRSLSTERLRLLIDALAAATSKMTGAPLTKGTLRSCREAAQRFTRWCAAQGRITPDPMVALKTKTLAQLHDEINTLRKEVFALRQPCDDAQQQPRARGAQ